MTISFKKTTDEAFENDVLHADLPTLVDFWAEWCGPCKMMMPVLEDVASVYKDRVNFYKVNVDENVKVSVQYGVRSIPYLVLFKKGQLVASKVGVQTKSQLLAFIDENI